MKLPELAIRNRTFTLFAVLLVVLAGIAAFFSLGQLEEPDFTIKVAVVSTPYPGATPTEVERDVTDRIESKLQELKQVDYLEVFVAGRAVDHQGGHQAGVFERADPSGLGRAAPQGGRRRAAAAQGRRPVVRGRRFRRRLWPPAGRHRRRLQPRRHQAVRHRPQEGAEPCAGGGPGSAVGRPGAAHLSRRQPLPADPARHLGGQPGACRRAAERGRRGGHRHAGPPTRAGHPVRPVSCARIRRRPPGPGLAGRELSAHRQRAAAGRPDPDRRLRRPRSRLSRSAAHPDAL